MRKLILLFLATTAWATTTVTGKIQTLGTGNVTSGAFVRFWLRGCGGNAPRIGGTSVIAPSQGGVYFFDIAANGSGNVSGTIYSTRDATGLTSGEIECGGSLTAVWYGMQVFSAGKGGAEVPIHAKNSATLDITNVTPITTNPVIASPTGDSTYARLDAGNQPFTGTVSPSGSGALGMGTTSNRWNGFFATLNANGAATLGAGGTLTGTFGGSPIFSGTPSFQAGAALAGTFSGTPIFSGLSTFQAGVLASYFSSSTANPAQSGILRLAASDTKCWRNAANSADVCMSKDGADRIVIPNLSVTGNISLTGNLSSIGNLLTADYGAPVVMGSGAAVDLTAQTAAITSTNLLTASGSGPPAGQYRLTWNAKVTTVAGVSSTLGPLTISYTDPDSVVQTITCAAQIAAGSVATTSAGNTTTTVLLGLPITINVKALTSVSYTFGYVSNAANAMNYNLHIRVEAL